MDPDGQRRLRAADRLREPRQPSAGAGHGTAVAKSRSARRSAPGAARLVRQLLVESLVLALIGGLAGVAGGTLFLDALVAWLPAGIPRIAEATVDGRVLLFTFAVSTLTGRLLRPRPGRAARAQRRGSGAARGSRARQRAARRFARRLSSPNWPSRWCCSPAPAC